VLLHNLSEASGSILLTNLGASRTPDAHRRSSCDVVAIPVASDGLLSAHFDTRNQGEV
jgi:hypothetical protein